MIVRWLVALMFAVCLPQAVQAGDFDGSKKLLCVPTDLMSCTAAGHCERTTARQLEIPQFVQVDVNRKLMSGKLEDGTERRTPIERVELGEHSTALQGGEYDRAWSLVIQHDTGKLSGAIAGHEGAVVVLGACRVD